VTGENGAVGPRQRADGADGRTYSPRVLWIDRAEVEALIESGWPSGSSGANDRVR